MHKDTLKRVLFAPVNTFFDVTPIGKVLKVYVEDMEKFYTGLIDQPKTIL